MATLAASQLSLAPLGAGDLIDRTIRLYRRHFMALIRASAPPVVVSAVGAVVMTIAGRGFSITESEGWLLTYAGLGFAGLVVWAFGFLLHWIVMGGASRNLVMHLLWGEPVSARVIYRNVRGRFVGLLGATFLVGALVLMCAGVSLVVWYVAFASALLLFIFASVGGIPVWLGVIVGLAIFAAGTYGAMYVFFLLVGRVAYVPQVMLVEGRGVFDAMGRSANLAGKNVRRLMAMFLFTSFTTYSALMLLLIPLGWLGYLNGVNPLQSEWPVWYAVSYQVVAQLSTILLTPVWMLGLSLLYVDERVRHEGYDVELQAARVLGDIPSIPRPTPLTPALAQPRATAAATHAPPPQPPPDSVGGSMHGLTDRR